MSALFIIEDVWESDLAYIIPKLSELMKVDDVKTGYLEKVLQEFLFLLCLTKKQKTKLSNILSKKQKAKISM